MTRLVVGSDYNAADAHARALRSRNASADRIAVGVDEAVRLCGTYSIIYIDGRIASDFYKRLSLLGLEHTGAIIQYSAEGRDGEQR